MIEAVSPGQLIHDFHSPRKPNRRPQKPSKTGRIETDNKPQGLDLTLLADRLKTFKDWSYDTVAPKALAEAGFFCLNKNSDLVRCAFCNLKVRDWQQGDDPIKEHRKGFPSCPFLEPDGEDVCGSKLMPEDDPSQLLKHIVRSHEDYKSRLETFKHWPKSRKQTPEELAKAGFVYKGVGDQTLCFFCGGGLEEWEDGDEPWEQHALWFPRCSFLVSSKGHDFIKEVQDRLRPEAIPIGSSLTTTEETGKGPEGGKDERQLCKICFTNEMDVVFIPCRHLVSCLKCSKSLGNVCPICRSPFNEAIKVFPS